MLQKRPTILDFKIINNLLFYKYPKFYVGFYCIRIYDTNLIESFINILKNSFNKAKIFGIMDLSEKNSFLFLKFKNRELNDILIKDQSIKSKMRKNIFRLVSKNELEKYFFFFMKQGQIEDITLSINKKERFLSLSDKNQINQQNIFKFKFKKTLLKENQKKEIISFFQTMKIKGYFLFSQKNSSKFWISFVLISNSFEKFLNFINFNESLQTRLNLKLTDISKKDFIDMIIKKQLSDSTLLNNSDFFNLIRDIDNEAQENLYFEKLTENRKKDQDNLIKKIILILEKSKIDYIIKTKSRIFIQSLDIQIIITNHNFRGILEHIKDSNYFKFLTIIFFSQIKDYKIFLHNTSVNKLKRVKVYSPAEIGFFNNYINEKKKTLLTYNK